MSSFRKLGATLRKDGNCPAEIRVSIASAVAATARLNRIWRSDNISLASKFRLYRSLILLYGCETWTLLSDSKKRI